MDELYSLQEENSKAEPRQKRGRQKHGRFWRFGAPLLVSAVCYLLLGLRDPLAGVLARSSPEPVLALLTRELYGYYMQYLFLVLPLLLSVLLYLGQIMLVPMREKAAFLRVSHAGNAEERRRQYREQYDLYAHRKASGWKTHAFYYLLFAAQLGLLLTDVAFGPMQREMQLVLGDRNLLQAGSFSAYEGAFHPTDRPVHDTYGYKMLPDERFYYFNSDEGAMRCLKSELSSPALMQARYRVDYLPGTRTVLSITNEDGVTLTGPSGPSIASLPEGTWLHGDLLVRRGEEVYGYDLLTADGQKAFDLLYGEYYSGAVARGEEPTHSFDLPSAIPLEEYRRVLSLYETATVRYSEPHWRYDSNDTSAGMIRQVYAGGIQHSGEDGGYFSQAQEKAAAIVAGLPPGLDERGICRWLADYLAAHVEYVTEPPPVTEFVDSDGVVLTVSAPALASKTAYGALVEGKADSDGYAKAFAALAYEAGLDSIYVVGEMAGEYHSWNMVRIGGSWYHIDVSMASGDGTDGTYFLASDREIRQTHLPVSYGACEFVPLPDTP